MLQMSKTELAQSAAFGQRSESDAPKHSELLRREIQKIRKPVAAFESQWM